MAILIARSAHELSNGAPETRKNVVKGIQAHIATGYLAKETATPSMAGYVVGDTISAPRG